MRDCAVIFDMDGVLVDSYSAHYQSWIETCNNRGYPFSEELFAELFGRGFNDFADRICQTPLTDKEISIWHDEKEASYRNIINDNFPEIDGAFDLIKNLSESEFIIGIASSGSRDNVDCLLTHLPSSELISATISASDTTNTKPHPEPFLKCAEMLNIQPNKCAVIEDSIYGLQAAKAGNMKAIGLAGTSSKEELSQYADLVTPSLTQLDATTITDLINS